MEFKDYYKIMGVQREATQDEIKRAYRKLARKYHPDVSKEQDADARFKELGEAYEVLKDPEKRVAYDQLGSDWKAGQEFRPSPDWDAGFEFSGGGFTGSDASAFSDFFETLFGQGGGPAEYRRSGFRARGEDHHAKILIDLEDAFHGATRTITLHSAELDEQGHARSRERTLNVRIPKGVKQGQHIRLAGQGTPGTGAGSAGDLYLEIEFKPHSRYRVEGRDLYLDLPLAPWEAALGAKVKVPTPQGVVDLTIPPGSVAGSKLRLKGRGIPDDPSGDFYAMLQVALPAADTSEAKALYQKMEQQLAFNPRASLGV
ncbi:MAG: DnaJ domain-containing protein [Gammaproteobacteria bacterium]|nr:DnaJ domain-containing protein [Gammaproteobacteria bacterium]